MSKAQKLSLIYSILYVFICFLLLDQTAALLPLAALPST